MLSSYKKVKPEIISRSQFCFHFHASFTSKVVVSCELNFSSTIANFKMKNANNAP